MNFLPFLMYIPFVGLMTRNPFIPYISDFILSEATLEIPLVQPSTNAIEYMVAVVPGNCKYAL
jgi:hypothetical protein